ncbi:DUF3761 domain-containing protein [Tenacibaculum ovolyticum]|uniref:DUF3761 domain-containing protein n=1 Tax=Tenacibaculum ovolyticum TaxID=104270 RepID=UPI001F236692|nr:DUF3761 domain-containing protein [Tenacibaculum ovolyticum]
MILKHRSGCVKGCGFLFVLFFIIPFILGSLLPKPVEDGYREAKRAFKDLDYVKGLSLCNDILKTDSTYHLSYLLKAKIFTELNDSIKTLSMLKKGTYLLDSLKLYKFNKEIIEWKLEKKDTIFVDSLLGVTKNIFQIKNTNSYVESHLYTANKYYNINKKNKGEIVCNLLVNSFINELKDTLLIQEYYRRVGEVFLNNRDTIRYISFLENTLKRNPKYKDSYQFLGDYYTGKKKYFKAIKYYKNHLKIDSSTNIINKIANNYLKIKYKKSAIKYYKLSADKGNKEACHKVRELTAKIKYYSLTLCCDGTTSSSTGRGTCSHHGGVCGKKYIPYKEYTIDCY